MPTLQMKMVSCLEKCFHDERIEDKQEKTDFVMFRNERLSFQVLYRNDLAERKMALYCPVRLSGTLAPYATVRQVVNVPVTFPTLRANTEADGEFLRTEPGLYPDLLRPMHYEHSIALPSNQLHSLWVDIELPEDFEAGKYDLSLSIYNRDKVELLGKVTGNITVLAAELPAQKLIHTEWFYTDCIANHYHTKAFSEKHWKYIESFLRTAVKNGINMILTPVFTPELDTYIGGERLTTQLVDIELVGDKKFAFGFDKLHRWIDLCLDCGVQYFEIAHFFTQWGATAAPKIMVKVNGRLKKYFGWHTDAMGEEYAAFLSQFIPALVAEFKKKGVDKNCFYHVSDEPHLEHLEHYTACKNLIAPYLDEDHIIDALSSFEFYETGALSKPVPHTRGAHTFIEAGVPGLWVYYCGAHGTNGVSDRGMAMPLARTRILGVQLYYYNIEGFLHWGYNFYNNNRSYEVIDPFGTTDGEFFAPSGDAYLVYPGTDGEAWESLRINAMRQAVDDMRALSLYEEKFGREATEKLILEGTDGKLTFLEYPTDPNYLLNLREKIAKALA